MPKWQLIGVGFGHDGHATYHRQLDDGTLLVAHVRAVDGRPECYEITARFPHGARDFGRELAISELERAINDNDTWWFPDARTGNPVSFFAFTEIPVGVTVRSSRGRPVQWTDAQLAALVRDLQNHSEEDWHLARNTIRERANQAVRQGIAEVDEPGPPKTWRLTIYGQELLTGKDT